jgi:hypothetical protein
VLEASGLVYLLPPYFKNFGKRMIKSSKLYFLDTGLATFLMGLHLAIARLGPAQSGHLRSRFKASSGSWSAGSAARSICASRWGVRLN